MAKAKQTVSKEAWKAAQAYFDRLAKDSEGFKLVARGVRRKAANTKALVAALLRKDVPEVQRLSRLVAEAEANLISEEPSGRVFHVKRNRETLTETSVYNQDFGDFDPDEAKAGMRYVAVCETHHTLVYVPDRLSGENLARKPSWFCEHCQGLLGSR